MVFDPEPVFPGDRNDRNPLLLGLRYAEPLVEGDVGETVTLDVFFRLSNDAGESQCTFQVTTREE